MQNELTAAALRWHAAHERRLAVGARRHRLQAQVCAVLHDRLGGAGMADVAGAVVPLPGAE